MSHSKKVVTLIVSVIVVVLIVSVIIVTIYVKAPKHNKH